MDKNPSLIQLTSEIVSAYVGRNIVDRSDLPKLIAEVYQALERAEEPSRLRREAVVLKPPVNIDETVTADYLICLEDGKKFKSLKRHLRTHFGLSPEQYRAKWGLPHNYPMVAPNYASSRSQLARNMGLGQKRGR